VLFLGRAERLIEIRKAGYHVISQRQASSTGEIIARIRIQDGQDVDTAIMALRTRTSEGIVGSNALYRASQAGVSPRVAAGAATTKADTGISIGMIDTGASTGEPAVASRLRVTRGFEGRYEPRDHGTRVAELLASSGATLYAADVFGVDQNGNVVASAEAITSALDWLSSEKLPVVNISIEGPRNPVVETIVRRYVAMGGVVVAAAGNGGPRAAPAFPAAYPGVVAVTALDAQGHVYRRANQGDYISFAARGVDLPLGANGERVSGTSYAAPIVAGVIAQRMTASPSLNQRQILGQLQREAIDLGNKGRDRVYGWGRIDPSYAPWPGAALGSRP
jgi:subtilisin family serine protease